VSRLVALASVAAAIGCSGSGTPPPEPLDPRPDTPAVTDRRERSDALDRIFGELLPRWVVALNSSNTAGTADPLREAAREALPADAAALLEAVLDRAREARDAPEPEIGAASDHLDDAVAALDRALSTAGLGYQIDASVITSGGDRSVLLFSFAVDRVRRYRSGDATYDALWVSRLDGLAFRYRLVGLAAERRDAMVLPPRVDEWLLGEMLPVIAAPERWRRGREPASSELPAAIKAALVSDLGAVAGDGLIELASAVEARLALLEGAGIAAPATLALSNSERSEIDAALSAADRRRLDELERRLGAIDAQIAFGKIRELAIAAIEHHEIQHQIDAAAGLRGLDGLEPAEAVARRELSAYLAEVARNRPGTRLAVIKLAGFALSPSAARLEREVASSILANLAAALGGSADSHGAEALSVATALILLRDREQISGAAGALWADHFGAPLAELGPL
jgi:hypothetical protein